MITNATVIGQTSFTSFHCSHYTALSNVFTLLVPLRAAPLRNDISLTQRHAAPDYSAAIKCIGGLQYRHRARTSIRACSAERGKGTGARLVYLPPGSLFSSPLPLALEPRRFPFGQSRMVHDRLLGTLAIF